MIGYGAPTLADNRCGEWKYQTEEILFIFM